MGGSTSDVTVIDTATLTVAVTIPLGTASRAIALSPDGARAYVTNPFAGQVTVIDTATNTVTATITGIPFPSSIAVAANGTAYVTNNGFLFSCSTRSR